MKALSIRQPWAHLIIHGIDGARKTVETRKWKTAHRGDLLICATKKPDRDAMDRFGFTGAGFEYGKAIGIVEVVNCRPMLSRDEKAAMCETYTMAWAWFFGNIRPIEPFAVKGNQRLYNVDYVNGPRRLLVSAAPLQKAVKDGRRGPGVHSGWTRDAYSAAETEFLAAAESHKVRKRLRLISLEACVTTEAEKITVEWVGEWLAKREALLPPLQAAIAKTN